MLPRIGLLGMAAVTCTVGLFVSAMGMKPIARWLAEALKQDFVVLTAVIIARYNYC